MLQCSFVSKIICEKSAAIKYPNIIYPTNSINERLYKTSDNQQQHSKDVLQELENVDGKADSVGIAFVKINDLELVDEYNLATIPSIVYFRSETPILFQGIACNFLAVLNSNINP